MRRGRIGELGEESLEIMRKTDGKGLGEDGEVKKGSWDGKREEEGEEVGGMMEEKGE
jgi:hypothetical protein